MQNFEPLPGLLAMSETDVSVAAKDEDLAPGTTAGYPVFTEGEVPAPLRLTREELAAAGFEGKKGQTLAIPVPGAGIVVALGAGEDEGLGEDLLRDLGASLARATTHASSLALVLPEGAQLGKGRARATVEGVLLARYKYSPFKGGLPTDRQADAPAPLERFTLVVPEVNPGIEAGVRQGVLTARSGIIARDITNAPPAHLTNVQLGELAERLGEKYGFTTEILEVDELTEMGCGGIVGVNRGSRYKARLIKLSYRPEEESDRTLALVGKGITFDSGGLSLKPSDSMLEMKMDLGGAAAVLGAFSSLRDFGVTTAVDGWIATTDNMISGDSLRLGEVLVARNGMTVEVGNTDAEGRLILMDILALAAETKPDWIVDIATLTGGAMVALGEDIAALFGTDQDLLDRVEDAATATGEPVWEMPLEPGYMKLLESPLADLSNVGGRWASPITAALFLSNFVEDVPWAHIDIAGPMSVKKDTSWRSVGATGFGARLLLELSADMGKSKDK